jgi:hypothetical protein
MVRVVITQRVTVKYKQALYCAREIQPCPSQAGAQEGRSAVEVTRDAAIMRSLLDATRGQSTL